MQPGAWNPPRLAATISALKDAGYTRERIGTLAGIHKSQVSRWASGEQRPRYDAAMMLAGRLRAEQHPGLADEFIAAAGYSSEPQPEPLVAPELAASLRRYAPEDADRIIAELERIRAARLARPGQAAC